MPGRRSLTFLLALSIQISAAALTFPGPKRDPLHLQEAFKGTSVVIVQWDHGRHSPVPRALRDQLPFLGASGVRYFIAEISRDHQADLDKGDFAPVYGQASGPRRARLFAAAQQAGMTLIAGDMEESFLALEQKDLKTSAATRDWDRKWMQTRSEQFAASISECLTKNARAKVFLLVDGAHAKAIAKLLAGGYMVRVIDGQSLHGDNLEEAEEVALDKMETLARWNALVDQKVKSYAIDTGFPMAIQRRLYALREATVIHSPERRRAEPRPPEILLHQMIAFAAEEPPTYPRTTSPEVRRIELLNKESQVDLRAGIPSPLHVGGQMLLSTHPHIVLRYAGYEGLTGLHVFEESRIEKTYADVVTVGVEDPGERHVLLSSKRIERGASLLATR